MPFPIPSAHAIARSLATLAFAASAVTVSAESADFEIGEGYLSASVRTLVESHDWSLVWSANEDRMVSHAFTIENSSLRGALESLLSMYEGQFVADLYRGNRVVVVNTPPPGVDVEVPGAESMELAAQTTVGDPIPAESDFDAGNVHQGTAVALVTAHDSTASRSDDGVPSIPATGHESETLAIESP